MTTDQQGAALVLAGWALLVLGLGLVPGTLVAAGVGLVAWGLVRR